MKPRTRKAPPVPLGFVLLARMADNFEDFPPEGTESDYVRAYQLAARLVRSNASGLETGERVEEMTPAEDRRRSKAARRRVAAALGDGALGDIDMAECYVHQNTFRLGMAVAYYLLEHVQAGAELRREKGGRR